MSPKPGAMANAALFSALFATSLACVRLLGLDSLGDLVHHHWQFLDIELLARAPFASLLLLHSQPPLLNGIAAILVRWPWGLYNGFVVANCVATAFTAWVIFDVLRRYVAAPGLAMAAAFLYVVSPAVMLNAAYPFYPALTAAGYAALVHAICVRKESPWRALIAGVVAIAWLSLLRSSFSPLHAMAALAWLAGSLRGRLAWRPLAVISALTVVVIFSVPVKNLALYGFFGSSSWAPLNLIRGVGIDRDAFIEPRDVAQLFPALECRYSYGPQDRDLNKLSGYPNFNSCLVLEYAQMQEPRLRQSYDPREHWKRIVYGAQMYLSPPDRYKFLSNRPRIESYAAVWDRLFLVSSVPRLHAQIRLLLVIATAIALGWALLERDGLVAFALVLVAVHFASHVLTDGEEAPRFVFDVEFVFYIFIGLSAVAVRRWAAEIAQARGRFVRAASDR